MRGRPSVLLLYLGLATCLDTSSSGKQEVFLDSPEAQSFLGSRKRVPRANYWDLELFTPGNLERECREEILCQLQTTPTPPPPTGRGRVDVASLAVGLTVGIVLIILAGLGAFWYLHGRRGRRQHSCPQEPLSDLSPQTPQPPPSPPGLPTYEQALAASGVHDAPPPPYTRYGAGLRPGGGAQREGTARGGAWA
uniref:Proline rich and Gla domain 2 n=1 Tax=Capra hircus TaxID=9925 RepID=A0A452FTK1_CAPHI